MSPLALVFKARTVPTYVEAGLLGEDPPAEGPDDVLHEPQPLRLLHGRGEVSDVPMRKQDGSAFSELMSFISNHFNIFSSYSNSKEV